MLLCKWLLFKRLPLLLKRLHHYWRGSQLEVLSPMTYPMTSPTTSLMTSRRTCPAHHVPHRVAHAVWHLQSHVVSHLVIAMSRCLCQTQTVASSCIASSHSYNLATCSHVGISVSMTFRIKKSQLPIRSPPGCTDRHRHILVEVSRFKRMKSTIVA